MKTSMKRTMMIGSLLLTLGACSSGEPEKAAAPEAGQPAAATAPAPDMAAAKQAVDKTVQQAKETAQAVEKAAAEVADETAAAAREARKAAEEAAAKAAEEAAAAARLAQQKAAKKASEAAAAMKRQAQASRQLAEGMAAASQARTETGAAEQAAASAPMGDAAKGKTLARKCATCHYFDARGKVGPGLGGVFNRVAGSVEGFNYKFADAIEPGKAWRWDASHLAAWVCNSADAVRNFTGNESARTKMPTQRICDPARQADLIAYLKTL